jgi:hypothetical protein
MHAGRQAMSAPAPHARHLGAGKADAPLAAPAVWHLQTGSRGAPLVRGLSRLLKLASAAMLLAWLAALAQEAFTWGTSPLAWAIAVLACLLGLLLWVPRSAGSGASLTLRWAGPVRRASWRRGAGATSKMGFQVPQWGGEAVRVRTVMDAQRYLLLSIEACHKPERPWPIGLLSQHKVWVWLDAARVDQAEHASTQGDMHRLRSLLALPPAMQTDETLRANAPDVSDAQKAAQVASWADSLKAGSKLRRIVSSEPARRRAVPSADQQESVFPPTVILDDPDAPNGSCA